MDGDEGTRMGGPMTIEGWMVVTEKGGYGDNVSGEHLEWFIKYEGAYLMSVSELPNGA